MGSQKSTHSITKADLAQAKELDRKFTEAMSRKDLDAAMDCFLNGQDLVVMLDGHVYRGHDAVRAAFKEVFDQNESVRLEVNEITHVPSGDAVIGIGTATYELKQAGRPPRLMVERWSDLRRKIDGRWVYVLDHTTEMDE
jgi:ketosteroid isomerase-like protein